ncbi:MAG TPA: AMP-binding protein [Nitriliruptorales bacterium]|nr:AMP-binding protein [Nitriliruptorales bacterium]
MFETAIAQLRFGASMALGVRFSPRSLERVVTAMRDTKHEFGSIGAGAGDLISGPALDEQTRREVQLRRFRQQVIRAARETEYYRTVVQRAGIDVVNMRFEDIERFPLTPKEHLREDPDAFIARTAKPALRATTTGTTGWPTSIYFSEREFRTIVALAAMSFMNQNLIEPEDIVQVNINSRALIGVSTVTGACARIGAPAYVAGAVSIPHTLKLLTERRRLPGKRPQVSIMTTYPSYLGELVEYGLEHGYRPSDFGLRRIWAGGEIVSEGLKARVRDLFGDVDIRENYGMTELVPFGGMLCSQGHLHYEPSGGLVEVESLERPGPALPGEPGTVVATPLAPYRETTVLLRYNTEDVVRPLAGPLTCSLRALPATTNLLGKQRLSVRHDDGWTLVRDVVEALESLPVVVLPARFGFRAVGRGVAVEVVTRRQDAAVRRQIETALLERDVPLRKLDLRADRGELEAPLPLRCDLKEISFAKPSGPILRLAASQGE